VCCEQIAGTSSLAVFALYFTVKLVILLLFLSNHTLFLGSIASLKASMIPPVATDVSARGPSVILVHPAKAIG